jgi:hypothetical protein
MKEQTNEDQMATLKKWTPPTVEIISRNSIESGSVGAPESLDTFGSALSDFAVHYLKIIVHTFAR